VPVVFGTLTLSPFWPPQIRKLLRRTSHHSALKNQEIASFWCSSFLWLYCPINSIPIFNQTIDLCPLFPPNAPSNLEIKNKPLVISSMKRSKNPFLEPPLSMPRYNDVPPIYLSAFIELMPLSMGLDLKPRSLDLSFQHCCDMYRRHSQVFSPLHLSGLFSLFCGFVSLSLLGETPPFFDTPL